MNFVSEIFPSKLMEAVGWTIFHSLWQGTLILILLFIVLFFAGKNSPRSNYAISVSSMFIMMLLAIITFSKTYSSEPEYNIQQKNELALITINPDTSKIIDGKSTDSKFMIPETFNYVKKFFHENMNYVFTFWLIGLIIFSLRFAGGLLFVQKIKSGGNTEIDNNYLKHFERILSKAKISAPVKIVESVLVNVPITIGNLKPIILLPIGILSGLPLNQVEAIIAHELAHIKRYDFFFNLFQSVIETIFFYHPAVWWISNLIRRERENCCDDIAVELCGCRLTYSKALLSIQQSNTQNSVFALALTGKDNQLLRRIKRMNEKKNNRLTYGIKFAGFSVLAMFVAFASLYSNKTLGSGNENYNHASIINPLSEILIPIQPEFTPEQNNFTDADTNGIKKGIRTFKFYENKDGNKTKYKAKLKDGKLEELYVDGDKIPDAEIDTYRDKVENKLEEYESVLKDYKKDKEEYAKLRKDFAEKMKAHREKLKEYNNLSMYNNMDEGDLSELREAMKNLRQSLKENFSNHSIEIPPIPNIHIPQIDIPEINIPPVPIPPMHIAPPDFDDEKFNEWKVQLKESLNELRNELKHEQFNSQEFKESMKEIRESMKKVNWEMDEFNDSMKVFGEKMKIFGVEMKKFGRFMKDAKNEMIEDGLIESGEHIDEFELSDTQMYVNGKSVSQQLHKKYLELYEKHTGKKLSGENKITIRE